jgi:3-isopropylmalate dehydratase small subunit
MDKGGNGCFVPAMYLNAGEKHLDITNAFGHGSQRKHFSVAISPVPRFTVITKNFTLFFCENNGKVSFSICLPEQ